MKTDEIKFRVSPEMKLKVKAIAAEQGLTLSVLIIKLMEQEIQAQDSLKLTEETQKRKYTGIDMNSFKKIIGVNKTKGANENAKETQ